MIKSRSFVRRIFVYVFGILILALGVSVSVKSGLGVSPNNSVPYAVNLATGIKMGTCSAAVFIVFVLIQIVILRREFKPFNLLQILNSILFGVFVNVSNQLLAFIPQPEHYLARLALMGVGIVLVSLGIFLYLSTDFVPLAAEGLAAALSHKVGKPIPKTKLVVDCLMVILAAAISLITLGTLQAVREGTILAALLIAPCLGQLMKRWSKPLRVFLSTEKEDTLPQPE